MGRSKIVDGDLRLLSNTMDLIKNLINPHLPSSQDQKISMLENEKIEMKKLKLK